MIGRLSGLLAEKNPPRLLIDANGVGYEVDVPMSTFYHLPAQNETVTLLIHHLVREDGQFLYGFLTVEERDAFRQLLKISGIGARTALSVLSGLSIAELRRAIATQESGPLTRIPGIGKKTAERLLLELRDKLPLPDKNPVNIEGLAQTDSRMPPGSDIKNALLALGYSEKEAGAALRGLPADIPTADGIRLALKKLSGF
jgi:Holliday junction DNA helicase RuvA